MVLPKERIAEAWAAHLAGATGQRVYAMRREERAEFPFAVVVVKRLYPTAPGENVHRAEVRLVCVSDAADATSGAHEARVAALYDALGGIPRPAVDEARGVVLYGFMVTEMEQVTAAGEDGRQVFSDVMMIDAGVGGNVVAAEDEE
jgi:hypothetical protein